MKKKINLCFILMSICIFSQSKSGVYSYKAPHYFESINLLKNGTFKYYKKTEFLKEEIFGNWQLRNDSILVLDSYPQKSKLNVIEGLIKKKRTIIHVKDFSDNPFHYYLYSISTQNDTIIYKDQFETTIIKEKPISFYLISSEGLHSPVYKIKGTRSNFFDVKFERQRIFENEQWKFLENSLIPLGLDGKNSNYKLVKE
ncbi:hypothetical protein [Chryseobacterium paludis]|uniref:hypothetical protein n=1 Tax=Chryseobacterium paludis TaxID=2956784 RepID=UPI0021C20A57|nr:hypothetical protein [Chryseobacterium paludis]